MTSDSSSIQEVADPATAGGWARLRRYVEHESPSGDVERCTALAELIAGDLLELGAEVSLIDAAGMGKHVQARFPHAGSDQHLLVLGHLDTVHPVGTLQRQPFAVLPERATGPGIFDMKAGVAFMIEAIATMVRESRRSHRPLRVLVTCDEEVGSHTARAVIEDMARGAHAVLVPEPSLPGGGAKTSRKGVATYRLIVHGRAAHAGIEPERGVNAITELVHQVLAAHALADAQLGTQVMASTIHGGTASNVVPAEAVASIDIRYANMAEGDRVRRELVALAPIDPRARLEVQQVDARPPLERTAGVIALYQQARSMAAKIGHDLAEGGTGGGSDGCLTAALGIPTLDGLGPQGGGAHSVDEHIRTDDVSFRIALYTALLEQL
ncbi:MAG: M20 family metallopeptidase [Longimicrobiales bacterium]